MPVLANFILLTLKILVGVGLLRCLSRIFSVPVVMFQH